jgi:hypothetical protein
MSFDIPTSQPPYAPPVRPPADNRSRNLVMAVVISLMIVCGGLTVIAQFINRDRIGKSNYPVKNFSSAMMLLGIEPPPQWEFFEGRDFTIYLPGRFELLSTAEQPPTPDLHGGQVRMMARDTASFLFGTNIIVMSMAASADVTPGDYVWSTADLMKKGGYQIKDKSAYELDGRSIGRLIYETATPYGQRAAGIQFAYVEDGTLWVIVGTVAGSDLDNWLPVLQEIARRFEVRPAGMDGFNTIT